MARELVSWAEPLRPAIPWSSLAGTSINLVPGQLSFERKENGARDIDLSDTLSSTTIKRSNYCVLYTRWLRPYLYRSEYLSSISVEVSNSEV